MTGLRRCAEYRPPPCDQEGTLTQASSLTVCHCYTQLHLLTRDIRTPPPPLRERSTAPPTHNTCQHSHLRSASDKQTYHTPANLIAIPDRTPRPPPCPQVGGDLWSAAVAALVGWLQHSSKLPCPPSRPSAAAPPWPAASISVSRLHGHMVHTQRLIPAQACHKSTPNRLCVWARVLTGFTHRLHPTPNCLCVWARR